MPRISPSLIASLTRTRPSMYSQPPLDARNSSADWILSNATLPLRRKGRILPSMERLARTALQPNAGTLSRRVSMPSERGDATALYRG